MKNLFRKEMSMKICYKIFQRSGLSSKDLFYCVLPGFHALKSTKRLQNRLFFWGFTKVWLFSILCGLKIINKLVTKWARCVTFYSLEIGQEVI